MQIVLYNGFSDEFILGSTDDSPVPRVGETVLVGTYHIKIKDVFYKWDRGEIILFGE